MQKYSGAEHYSSL